MRFPDLHQQSKQHDTDQPPSGPDPSSPGPPPDREPGPPSTATAAADPSHQRAEWPVPGWQWASLVGVLLGGQIILLVLTVWTLATSASHGWATPIILSLGLLARLVPDILKLAEWAATATSWTPPPVDRRLHLGVAVAALVLANLVAMAA
jgi:hypothetical protein